MDRDPAPPLDQRPAQTSGNPIWEPFITENERKLRESEGAKLKIGKKSTLLPTHGERTCSSQALKDCWAELMCLALKVKYKEQLSFGETRGDP